MGGEPSSKTKRAKTSDAAALAGTAAVVRDRRHVADRSDVEAGRLDGAQRRFAPGTGAGNLNLKRAQAVLAGLAHGVLGRHLRRERRRFARALETHRAGRRPRDGVALRIGDGNHRVVERRIDVRDAGDDVFALLAADASAFLGHASILYALASARNSMLLRTSGLLLLARNGLRLALAGAGVGVRALAADRKLLAMAQAAIGAEIHQALDVDRHLAAQIALDHIIAVDGLADLQHFGVRKLENAALVGDMHLLADLLGL